MGGGVARQRDRKVAPDAGAPAKTAGLEARPSHPAAPAAAPAVAAADPSAALRASSAISCKRIHAFCRLCEL